jgi:hypothetical protein
VGDGRGNVALASTSGYADFHVVSTTALDTDTRAAVSFDRLPATGSYTATVSARWVADGTDYRLHVDVLAGGALDLLIEASGGSGYNHADRADAGDRGDGGHAARARAVRDRRVADRAMREAVARERRRAERVHHLDRRLHTGAAGAGDLVPGVLRHRRRRADGVVRHVPVHPHRAALSSCLSQSPSPQRHHVVKAHLRGAERVGRGGRDAEYLVRARVQSGKRARSVSGARSARSSSRYSSPRRMASAVATYGCPFSGGGARLLVPERDSADQAPPAVHTGDEQ